MALLNGTRLILLLGDSHRSMGIDYEETFASVAKMTSIRTLIVLAATR